VLGLAKLRACRPLCAPHRSARQRLRAETLRWCLLAGEFDSERKSLGRGRTHPWLPPGVRHPPARWHQPRDFRRADDGKTVHAEINLTKGTIKGNAGLNGTVAFVADGAGSPPPTGPPGSSVFSGSLTISTDKGVLDVRETGMFSSRTGNPGGAVLSAWGDVLGGTGRYGGATGDLFFAGRLVDGAFLVDVSGDLCRP
jgi:hypothetical protein